MRRRAVLFLLIAICACGRVDEPKQPATPQVSAPSGSKVTRVGWLATGNAPTQAENAAGDFQVALKDLGYTLGPNFVIEYRYAGGDVERLRQLAGDLVAAKVDVIVAAGESAAQAAKRATTSIPIVAIELQMDPVKAGIVKSLARPEANVTGLDTRDDELWQKRLSVFRQVIPKLARAVVLSNPKTLSSAACIEEIRAAAPALGVEVQSYEVADSGSLERALAALPKDRPDALLICWDSSTLAQAPQIADVARKQGLPTLASIREYAEGGSMMTYGISLPAHRRRAAFYVDKLLKGTKPGELPVERAAQVDLVFNLGTAKAVGIAIQPGILTLADELIR